MARPQIYQSKAIQLVREGKASPQEIAQTFDLVPDPAPDSAAAPPPAPSEPSLWDDLKASAKDAPILGPFSVDSLVGAAKSAGQTIQNLGSLASKYVPGVKTAADYYAGRPGASDDAFQGEGAKEAQAALDPQGFQQQAGALAEQVGEMALGGEAELPGALAGLSAAAKSRLATLAATSPRVAKLIGLAGQGLKQGISNASASAARGDDPLVSGAMGAAGPFVGSAGEALFGKAAQMEKARALWAKILAPSSRASRVVASDTIDRLIQDGVPYASRASLGNTAADNVQTLQRALELAHSAKASSGATIPLADIQQRIDQKVAQLTRQVPRQVISGGIPISYIDEVPLPGAEGTVQGLKGARQALERLAGDASEIPYQDVLDARRSLDQKLARQGVFGKESPAGLSSEQAADFHTANALRDLLADANPDAVALNSDYGHWKDVDRMINGASGAITREQLWQEIKTPASWGAAAELLHSVHANKSAALIGAAAMGRILKEAYQTTAYRSASAVARAATSRALTAGDMDKAFQLLVQMGAAKADDRPNGHGD